MENNTSLDINFLLGPGRIRSIYERLLFYKEKYGGKVEDIDGGEGNEAEARFLVQKYAICTSFLLGVFNDNVVKKKIVEVGPDYAGRFMLDYLVELGANVSGVDRHDGYQGYLGPSKGKYLTVPLEQLSEAFSPLTLDMVHIKSMHPYPYSMEVKRNIDSVNHFKRWRAIRVVNNYPALVARNIDIVLKNRGYFMV